jgi:uncharacterized protein
MRLNQIVESKKKKFTQTEMYYDKNGKMHRLDGPAYSGYRSHQKLAREEWLIHGKHHSKEHPSLILYYPKGTPNMEAWDWFGKGHRLDGPAVTYYNPDGTVSKTVWLKDGQTHRDEDLPAVYDYENRDYQWYKNENPHRDNGPAGVRRVNGRWYYEWVFHGNNFGETEDPNNPPGAYLDYRKTYNKEPFPKEVWIKIEGEPDFS